MTNIINHHGNVEEVSDTSFFTRTKPLTWREVMWLVDCPRCSAKAGSNCLGLLLVHKERREAAIAKARGEHD